MTATAEFIKNYNAAAAIQAYMIVKFGATQGEVTPATAETDKLTGVAASLNIDAGDRVDVTHHGPRLVVAAAPITQGDWLTANSLSQAVACGTGANIYSVGFALENLDSGTAIVNMFVSPHKFS